MKKITKVLSISLIIMAAVILTCRFYVQPKFESKSVPQPDKEEQTENLQSAEKQKDTEKTASTKVTEKKTDDPPADPQKKNNDNKNTSQKEKTEENKGGSEQNSKTEAAQDSKEQTKEPEKESDKQNETVYTEDNKNDDDNNETVYTEDEQKDNSDQDKQDKTPKQSISKESEARIKFILKSNPALGEEKARSYVEIFETLADQRSYIDADTLMGIARIESVFKADAVAKDKSGRYIGLMQLHESYEASYKYEKGQLFDPFCNVECACKLLDSYAKYYSYNLSYAVQAYNQGPIAVDKQIAAGKVSTSYWDLVCKFAGEIRSMYQ